MVVRQTEQDYLAWYQLKSESEESDVDDFLNGGLTTFSEKEQRHKSSGSSESIGLSD